MALIIKADMPDCCGYECDLWSEGICVPLQKGVDLHTRVHDCPIIEEIPDNHGRLIDADELEKAVEKMVICDSYEYTIAHQMIKGLLKIAPTVLEAST